MATAELRSTDAVFDRIVHLARRLDSLDEQQFAVRRLPRRPSLNLRGDPSDAGFLASVGELCGVELPLEPNSWTGDDERAALWLGPDEWLLVAREGEAEQIEAALREQRGDAPWLSVVDLSGNYAVLQLSGPRTREVLSAGCPLDLHPRAFAGSVCVQTVLGQARVILRLLDEGAPAIEVWVRNSFLLYLEAWLAEASAEYAPAPADRREARP